MSTEVAAEQQQRPPPYHHHRHRRYSRYGPASPIGVQRGTVNCRIPAIEKHAHCLCLHVKPTTIFIAALKLIDAFLFVSILLNAELSFDDQSTNDFIFNGNDGGHRSTAVAVGIMTRIILASASAVAIYAVISGRAALLMPLYSVLLIDFFFALPSFYARDIESGMGPDSVMGVKNYPALNGDQYNRYSVFISTITMVVKIYFLCVIWKCYRYLRYIQLMGELCSQMPNPIVRVLRMEDGHHDINPNQSAAPPPYESVASSLKPPNYEEAIKSSGIYSIDIQPQNSHLPNYSSIPRDANLTSSATSHQSLPVANPIAPAFNNEAVQNTITSDGQVTGSTALNEQKEHSRGNKIEDQFIDIALEPAQSPQTGDILQSETTSDTGDKVKGEAPSNSSARNGSP